jgi:hypothetical protein
MGQERDSLQRRGLVLAGGEGYVIAGIPGSGLQQSRRFGGKRVIVDTDANK